MKGVRLVTSDKASGLIGLIGNFFPGATWQRCVVHFERNVLKDVPTNKAESVGMRKLSSEATLKDALLTLKGKPKIKRIMWSRRAQEYEAKINSGDLVSIAEVVRDLHRAEDQPEQSYSERQIFEAAISRLAREVVHPHVGAVHADLVGALGEFDGLGEHVARRARGRSLVRSVVAEG